MVEMNCDAIVHIYDCFQLLFKGGITSWKQSLKMNLPPQKEVLMKSRTLIILTMFLTLCLLFSCGTIPAPMDIVEKTVKKAIVEPTFQVMEINMEKTDRDIKITGTATYLPADADPKAFSEFNWDVKVEFYDANGNKLPFSLKYLDYGENNNPGNIIEDQPFPFMGETSVDYMGQDTFDKAASCNIVYIKAY